MAICTGLALTDDLIHYEESNSSSSEQHQKVGPQHAGRREAMQVACGQIHALCSQGDLPISWPRFFLASPKQPIDQVRFYLCSRNRLFYLEWNRLDVFVRHFCLDPYLSLILIFNYEYILK
jgi:hypothetical protein